MKPIKAKSMIGIWSLVLYSPQSQKQTRKGQQAVPGSPSASLTPSLWFLCVFLRRKKQKKKPCLPTWTCMSACLILRVCVSIRARVRGQKWRCYPVVIHHARDTRSPALLYAEAMFYKRITRQRAPGGHPLPPRATSKHIHWTSTAFITHLYVFGSRGTGQGFFAREDFNPSKIRLTSAGSLSFVVMSAGGWNRKHSHAHSFSHISTHISAFGACR